MSITKLPTKVTATVTHKEGQKAHAKVVTSATIWLNGDVVVAHGELGGMFSETQALEEFRRLPHRFVKHAGWGTYNDLRKAGLVK
jgi:hypothetical protein